MKQPCDDCGSQFKNWYTCLWCKYHQDGCFVQADVVSDSLDGLVGNLRELQKQWMETSKLIRPIDNDGAVAYLECVDELGEILDGNLSSIERISNRKITGGMNLRKGAK